MVRRSKQTFLQRKQMAKEHMGRCSSLLIIREMHIKTTLRHHSHPSEWPSFKGLETVNAGEGVEKREPSHTVGGNVSWYSHYGKQYGASLKKKKKKLNIELPYDPAIPLLDLYPEKTVIQNDTCTLTFIVALF